MARHEPSDEAVSNVAELKRPLGVIGQGFLLIGGLSYIIKVVHLPLNEILVCPTEPS
jgi:preprotein translocase subunit Sss1